MDISDFFPEKRSGKKRERNKSSSSFEGEDALEKRDLNIPAPIEAEYEFLRRKTRELVESFLVEQLSEGVALKEMKLWLTQGLLTEDVLYEWLRIGKGVTKSQITLLLKFPRVLFGTERDKIVSLLLRQSAITKLHIGKLLQSPFLTKTHLSESISYVALEQDTIDLILANKRYHSDEVFQKLAEFGKWTSPSSFDVFIRAASVDKKELYMKILFFNTHIHEAVLRTMASEKHFPYDELPIEKVQDQIFHLIIKNKQKKSDLVRDYLENLYLL